MEGLQVSSLKHSFITWLLRTKETQNDKKRNENIDSTMMSIDNYHIEPIAQVEILPTWLRILSGILAVSVARSALAIGAAGLMLLMMFDDSAHMSSGDVALAWMMIACYYLLVLKLAVISVPLMETARTGRLSKKFIHSGIAALIALITPGARTRETVSAQKRILLGVLVIPCMLWARTFSGYLGLGSGVMLDYKVAILLFVAEMAATACYYAYISFTGRELQDISNLSHGTLGSDYSQENPSNDQV